MNRERWEAQLEADVLSEKWDVPEGVWAPWSMLGPEYDDLKARCEGSAPFGSESQETDS